MSLQCTAERNYRIDNRNYCIRDHITEGSGWNASEDGYKTGRLGQEGGHQHYEHEEDDQEKDAHHDVYGEDCLSGSV